MSVDISKIAVIGGGVLGAQIAIQSACFDFSVSVYDSDEQAFDKAVQNFKSIMGVLGKGPVVSLDDWERSIQTVRMVKNMEEALIDADLVIEAVPEDLELKRRVFTQIDALTPPRAILATNSSSIPISKIEDVTQRPEHCLNLHFYMPVAGNNLVDIMGGSQTTDSTMEAGKQWIRSIGCIPLTVNKEIFGFCFNRVWRSVKREVLHMWAEGFVDFRDIDRAWMVSFGMDSGPFGLMDMVGLDVTYNVEMSYYKDSKEMRDEPPEPLKAMVERKELGVKTGKGFYTYPDPEYAGSDFLKG